MIMFLVAPLSALWLPLVEKPTSPAWANLFSQLSQSAGQQGTRGHSYYRHIVSVHL